MEECSNARPDPKSPIGMEGEAIFDDLMLAAQSSLHFWDDPLDDEEWNNAWEGRI
jgi:hypothetical protein